MEFPFFTNQSNTHAFTMVTNLACFLLLWVVNQYGGFFKWGSQKPWVWIIKWHTFGWFGMIWRVPHCNCRKAPYLNLHVGNLRPILAGPRSGKALRREGLLVPHRTQRVVQKSHADYGTSEVSELGESRRVAELRSCGIRFLFFLTWRFYQSKWQWWLSKKHDGMKFAMCFHMFSLWWGRLCGVRSSTKVLMSTAWIAIDTDYNKQDSEYGYVFVTVDNIICVPVFASERSVSWSMESWQ